MVVLAQQLQMKINMKIIIGNKIKERKTFMLLPITTSVSQILEPIRDNAIYFPIMTTWIAPHGATDVIDAFQNKKVPKMLSCYFGAVGFGEMCSVFDADVILYGLFALASLLNCFLLYAWSIFLIIPNNCSPVITGIF